MAEKKEPGKKGGKVRSKAAPEVSKFVLLKKDLVGCTIGLDLLDGSRLVGSVHDWEDTVVWVKTDTFNKPIDVIKGITQRMLVCIPGGLSEGK